MKPLPRKLIRSGCVTQMVHTFTIAFLAFHAIFEITLMILSRHTVELAPELVIPGLSYHTSFLIYSILGVVLYLTGIVGIVLILRGRKGGIFLLYLSTVLLIIHYLIKEEPDWYSALTLAIIIIFYVVFLHLIRTHPKLESEQITENHE